MMLTTGMLMSGKISVGVRTIASVPKRKIRIASTIIVYGSFSASLTIHIMIHILNSVRHSRTALTQLILFPVLRRLGIQGRTESLGGSGNCSAKNNVPDRATACAFHFSSKKCLFASDLGQCSRVATVKGRREFRQVVEKQGRF